MWPINRGIVSKIIKTVNLLVFLGIWRSPAISSPKFAATFGILFDPGCSLSFCFGRGYNLIKSSKLVEC